MDGAGNIFGRLEIAGKPATAVLAGSHIDSVPNGGRFDGALGVLSVLEALRTIRESGAAIRHPVEVVAFTDEEGRFGGFLGSKAFTGNLTKQEIEAARDPRGVRLADAMKKAGFPPAAALKARAKPSAYRGYVELHVEQGLVLEESGAEVGVVTGIVGLWKFEIAFHGRPDHAGTTPFPLRKDAYLGAAEFGAGLRKLVRKHGSPITVATVGYIELSPGASNIVPETARFTVDLRDLSMPVLGRMRKAIRENLREIARKHGLKVTMEQTLEAKSVKMSAKVRGPCSGPRSGWAPGGGTCTAARATTPRSWASSHRPGSISSLASAAEATAPTSFPGGKTSRRERTSCCTRCWSWRGFDKIWSVSQPLPYLPYR